MDQQLAVDDARLLVDELLEAQNTACLLALELKIVQYDIDALDKQYPVPKDKLYRVIVLFLQRNPKPTRRIIVNALKSPKVKLLALARTIEENHLPASTPETSLASSASPSTSSVSTETTRKRRSLRSNGPSIVSLYHSVFKDPYQIICSRTLTLRRPNRGAND